ncbi:MAG: VOC family protein [Candidatus Sumerlaeota bacterium]|nr:VOC family protein [Candidatus Sumerlaeota bacterium]
MLFDFRARAGRGLFAWVALALALTSLPLMAAGESATSDSAPLPKIIGLSHIAVKVSDIEKAIPFYRDFLGFAEEFRLNNLKDGSLMLVCFKVSETQSIEVFTGLKPGENRLYQIAFQLQDAEAMRAHLSKNNIHTPASIGKGQIKNFNFTVKDPSGYTIEFVQYLPDGWTIRDKGKFLPDTRISERITHAGVVTTDVLAANHFYGDVLGMKETWRGSSRGDAISWIHLRLAPAGDYVELMLDPKTAPHFCLEVPDMEKAKAKLEASSYRTKYEKPIELYIGKNRRRIINLFDPDGTRVELMAPNTIDGKPVPPSDAPLPKI